MKNGILIDIVCNCGQRHATKLKMTMSLALVRSVQEIQQLVKPCKQSCVHCQENRLVYRVITCGGFVKWGHPKSSIFMGLFIINHPFWGTPHLWNPP